METGGTPKANAAGAEGGGLLPSGGPKEEGGKEKAGYQKIMGGGGNTLDFSAGHVKK